MDPITIHFPAISTNALFSGTAANLPAGSQLLLNGIPSTNIFTGQTNYTYLFDPGIQIQPWIVNNSGVNYSGMTFTFRGTNNWGESIVDVVTGPTANNRVIADEAFHTLTSIVASGIVQPNLTIGLSGAGDINVSTDYWNKSADYSIQYSDLIISSGGPHITSYFSATKPTQFNQGIYQYNPDYENSLFEIPLTNSNVMISPDTDTDFPISTAALISIQGMAIAALRTHVTSGGNITTNDNGTGSMTLTVIQQGARY